MLVCNAKGSGPSRGSNFSLATFLSENVVQHLYVFLLPRTFSTSYPEEIYGMIVICWRRNANRSHNWERSSETRHVVYERRALACRPRLVFDAVAKDRE